ncbi:EboA domain-containing protein [Streptomyces radicis]|uniref:Sugar phosphate isomerase n=1 Tax=Streptomyces radicis TaxID=1750517 RepID=A0A3A9VZX1_9ACTN|nr:EboA domain-containing protein [Streptomyces radicis]RKN06458.1 sugar phosphate isomerase [Streptomyces radicis]RKN20283.1 sugar phosphate isomerase [Streptomyces radicis]
MLTDPDLTPEGRAWLDGVAGAEGWETAFTAAGRHVGRDHADAARVELLRVARPDAETLTRLYQRGDAAERRAVLLALPELPLGPEALPLVEDALRANDARLIAAALGPYAARHLDQHLWRHAVLKCVFIGVPIHEVAGLADRADIELARMARDFAAERAAAGRPVPDDVRHILSLVPDFPPVQEA